MPHSFQTDIRFEMQIFLAHWRPHLLSERLRCSGERVPRSWACQPVSRDSSLISASSASLLTRLLCYKRPPDEKPASCQASSMFRNLLGFPNACDHTIIQHPDHGKKDANSFHVFRQRTIGGRLTVRYSPERTAVPPSFLQASTHASIRSKSVTKHNRTGFSSPFIL